MRSVLEMSFDAEVLATYLAALSELASLKEVILGLPRPGGHFSQVEIGITGIRKLATGEEDCKPLYFFNSPSTTFNLEK